MSYMVLRSYYAAAGPELEMASPEAILGKLVTSHAFATDEKQRDALPHRARERMMLGSITRSFRLPTITRCSILSRRTRMTLRFPSTGRVSITATRAGALRR